VILEILLKISAVDNFVVQYTLIIKDNDVVSKTSSKVVIVPVNFKLLKKKEMDKFLDEIQKKSISNEIKHYNKKKKFLCKLAKNQIQDITSNLLSNIEIINNSINLKLSYNKKTVTIDNN